MHPDIPEEQAYFDRVLLLRESLEANRGRAAGLPADPQTATELRRRAGALGVVDPGAAVAFGRIDADDNQLYIGKRAIWDENNELVVVNWQAPVVAPFYTATPDDREGLDARRVYHCANNRILDIDETVFSGIAMAIANGYAPTDPTMSDALLDSLARSRSGELTDIVATIQAEQYDVITRDPEQLLVVQGGPGTGKTVVGLHRVSWMLHDRRGRWEPNDMLIVGPNPAFIRYISAVLPSLGEEAVVQLPITALGPKVQVSRIDAPEVRRLKGDRRMLRLMLRAVRNRQRPQRGPIDLEVAGRTVRLDGDRIVARARQLAGLPHNDAARDLWDFVVDEVQQFFSRRGLRGLSTIDDMVRGEATDEIDNYIERIWPTLTPIRFFIELFATRRHLETAAAGLLTGDEIAKLLLASDTTASGWRWSVDDVPLLDLADALLNGSPPTYEHIMVDEAQNLSPMQLESIRRRSRTGWMTVLGDLAQATGPWAPESWEEIALHLRRDRVPTEIVELSLGYRLPKEIHDVAMRLLPEIAPRVRPPEALRSIGHDVTVLSLQADELAVGVADAAAAGLGGPGLVAVVTSARDRSEVTAALDADGLGWASELQPQTEPIVVLGADDVTGLEFDHVVVVEPAQIVRESPQGLRALFVVLTRATNRLTLVHTEPIPEVLGLSGSPVPTGEDPWAARDAATARHLRPAMTGAVAGAGQPQPPPSDAVDQFRPHGRGEEAGSTSVAGALSNSASSQTEPLAELDRAMARAVAGKLAEALVRYVQPALLPLVVEEMHQVLDIDQPGQAGAGDGGDRGEVVEGGSARGGPIGPITRGTARPPGTAR